MAKFKKYSYEQQLLLPVSLERQLLPDTFEYTLNLLINKKLDLSIFYEKYKNDLNGAPAYDPAILLKIVLFAYSKGIISSRKIAEFSSENIVCIALSADSKPHFTTIAHFISTLDDEITSIFTQVVTICYTENLIGKNMFAIDGCKLSSNCSKEWSGTKTELMNKVEKIKKSIEYLVKKHKEEDENPTDPNQIEREKKSIEKLKAKADKISTWLKDAEDRKGARGTPVKSNITDNESAKMATSHGVIQGYNGIATADDKHQVIIHAKAYGDSNESGHLTEILQDIHSTCSEAGVDTNIYEKVKITADSGYHNEQNMEYIVKNNIDAYIADNQFRKRDVRFDDRAKHRKKTANWQEIKTGKYFTPKDFLYNAEANTLTCPAGNPMWLKCSNYKANGGKHTGVTFKGHVHSCQTCDLRKKCLRNEKTKARQVTILSKGKDAPSCNYSEIMRQRFDTPYSRQVYSKRMGTIEPVFGNIRGTKKLNHFTLRGSKKVNIQWLLFCLVHNIGKVQVFGKSM